jgi:YHS domain-containing protein
MARFILFVILLLLFYAILHTLIKGMSVQRKKLNRESEPEELVQDPYCQTYIPKQSAVKKKIAGRLVYFCNQECMKNYINKIKKKS